MTNIQIVYFLLLYNYAINNYFYYNLWFIENFIKTMYLFLPIGWWLTLYLIKFQFKLAPADAAELERDHSEDNQRRLLESFARDLPVACRTLNGCKEFLICILYVSYYFKY